jgi:S1-C subfamily serine protease
MKTRSELAQIAEALKGIPVWGALRDSASHRAGVRYGDVIVSVNGIPTPTIDDYVRARDVSEGSMTMVVFRDGAYIEFTVAFDEHTSVRLQAVAKQLVDERLVPTVRPSKRTFED